MYELWASTKKLRISIFSRNKVIRFSISASSRVPPVNKDDKSGKDPFPLHARPLQASEGVKL